MDEPWRSLIEETKTSARTLAQMQAELSALGVRSLDRAADSASSPGPSPEGAAPLSRLFRTLDSFPTLVGYLQGRRSDPLLVMKNEAAVQDLLYLSLKPMLPELVFEEPTHKGAAGYSIGDFSLMSMKLILEVKYVKVAADVSVVWAMKGTMPVDF